MTYEELKQIDEQYYMKTFGARLPVVFTGGKAPSLWILTIRNISIFLPVSR